jgi:hypothetical protein
MVARRGRGSGFLRGFGKAVLLGCIAVEAIRPDYAGANVCNIVPSLLRGRSVPWMPEPVAGAASVVLLVLDGLGWEAIRNTTALVPELASLEGAAITTVVPSTTPAALTSISTGLPPARHGVTGFRIHVDHAVLNAIRWQRDDNKRAPEPSAVQPNELFDGRAVPVITKAEFRTSGFTGAHLRGTKFLGWQTTAVLVEHVRRQVEAGATFVYAYYPGVDEVAHAYGLRAPFYAAELAAADRLVGGVRDALPPDAALLVTADHGQVHLEPDAWVSLEPLDPLVDTYAGDARFRYLYARTGAADDLRAAAEALVGDDAWVFTRERILDEGWMGEPSGAGRRRVGDVVLAARAPVGFVDPTFARETHLRSAHGSLTPAEMEVPLLAGRGRAR